MERSERRALIYDFDDTIVESERLNDVLFADLLRREYSVSLSPEDLETLYGLSWSGVFSWLAERRGLKHGREEIWARFIGIKLEFLRGRKLRVARGFDRMLSLPVVHSIVSGSTRVEIVEMMKNIGLSAERFSLILTDEDCGNGKPDPEGFLLALARLGVPAERCLAFEDSTAGIEAARKAGIRVAFIGELASRDNSRLADLRFDTFEQAYPWVRDNFIPGRASENRSPQP